MSDKKITELADGGAVQATDEFVVARAGGNVKIAGSQIGSGGGSSSNLYARLSIQGGSDSGADVAVPIVGTFFVQDGHLDRNIDAMSFTGPSTFAAGHHTRFWVTPPASFPTGGVLTLNYAEFMVSNGAGTQKLRIEYDGDPIDIALVEGVSGPHYVLPFADCSILEQIGSDLSLVSIDDGTAIPSTAMASIQTTAGGQFFQELLVTLGYTQPT